MRFLITGGAGFLGSELTTSLSKSKKNEIYVFDSYAHGYPKTLPQQEAVKDLMVGNIKDFSAISRAVERSEPDVVIHLAAHITRPESVGEFRSCAEVNYVGTANLLEACLRERYKPKKIIFASSEAVRNPTSHYGISKLAAERLLESICPLAEIGLGILRFSEIYGISKSHTSQSLINFLVDRMVVGQSIAVFDVKRRKDCLHISDAVKACKAAIRSSNPLFKVDIGSGEGIVTQDLIEKLKNLLDFEGQFKYLEHSGVRVFDSVADTAAAEEVLGFKCAADFDKELQAVVAGRRKDLTKWGT